MITLYALVAAAALAPSPTAPAIRPLSARVSWLEGSSCNVVIVQGKTTLLLIDDQRARDYEETRRALDQVYHLPVAEVVNTHWHLDHAGGNQMFAASGAVIVAHANVRKRLAEPQYMSAYKQLLPPQLGALPGKTYRTSRTLSFDGETLTLVHVAHAHTDGDTIVKVVDANVIHMGDLFFNGMFPFIDLDSGGSIHGVIHSLDVALRNSDGRTTIVPGHGPLATRADLVAYRTMLLHVAAEVQRQIALGHDLGVIVGSKPAAAYKLEGDDDQFVAAVYAGYKRR